MSAVRLLQPIRCNVEATAVASSRAAYSSDTPDGILTNKELLAMKRGKGGRSSFSGNVATIFGATGFMGKYLCNRLGKCGTQIIIPYRGDDYDPRPLKLAGDLGQVLFSPYYIRDEDSVRKALKYSNIVINLTGRDYETKNFTYDDIHVSGARLIARIAREAGVKKLIHFSALNAVENPQSHIMPGGSQFLASKWRGEQAVREEFPDAIIMRPADTYGQEDRFLRYYSSMFRLQANMMPLWKKGEHTVKQPVYVGDVAAGVVGAINSPESTGQVYEAVGPKRYLLSELVDWFYRIMRKDELWNFKRYDIKWDPLYLARVYLNEKLAIAWPINTQTRDKLERECVTDVLTGLPTLEDLGVELTPMENQVAWELKPRRAQGHYLESLGEFAKPAPPKVTV